MRIIAGTHGSRRFDAPDGKETRPTLDKVREAVFSSIGGVFDGGAVLDLYAGSGAVGFEALSRGKDNAVFVDCSKDAVRVIRKNIDTLGFAERSLVLPVRAEKAVRLLAEKGQTFDLIYLDPPYRLQENVRVIELIQSCGLLAEDAVLVIESLKEERFPETIGTLVRYKEACYGISRISYYRNQAE